MSNICKIYCRRTFLTGHLKRTWLAPNQCERLFMFGCQAQALPREMETPKRRLREAIALDRVDGALVLLGKRIRPGQLEHILLLPCQGCHDMG